MGLFRKNKQVVWSLPEKQSDNFIYSVSSWMAEVKLGTKIIVPQGWWCIFVTKDKPCDILDSGEYVISLDTIPLVTKLLKLQKPITKIKHGKKEKVYRESFKSFVYFVNKNAIKNLTWQTDSIVLKKKNVAKNEKKRFDVILSGVTDLCCVDCARMMKFFLYEWAKVDSFKAKNRISEYIGEIVGDIVGRVKIATPQEIDDLNFSNEKIIDKLQKELGGFGMSLENFAITKTIFDKDIASMLLQEKMEKDIASDEINELGAEISMVDDKTTEEKRGGKKGSCKVGAVEIMDMTATDEDSHQNDVGELKKKIKNDIVEDEKLIESKNNIPPKVKIKTERFDKE